MNINSIKYSDFTSHFINSLRHHAIIISVIFLYAIARIIFCYVYNVENIWSSWFLMEGMQLTVPIFLVSFFCGRAIYIMISVHPVHLIKYIINDFRKNFINSERITFALPLFLLLPVFISTFIFFKSMIPVINPYSWDYKFFVVDGVMHGGFQPWQLLQPILGKPIITSGINFFYNLWFFVMYMVVLWQIFSMQNTRHRMRFFLTYIGAWILLGNVLATMLSSVGPCYYGRLMGSIDPYQPLMEYLRAANTYYPVWSLYIQDLLWNNYVSGGKEFAKGISAMPSLHVSMAFLFVLVSRRNVNVICYLLSFFTLVIIIGSIHLGWHYAIDDYVAIVSTFIIWQVAAYVVDRYDIL